MRQVAVEDMCFGGGKSARFGASVHLFSGRSRMSDRRRYRLDRSEWHNYERRCWDMVILPRLRSAQLRESSIAGYYYTYCTWLGFLRTVNSFEQAASPLRLTERHSVKIFIEQISERASAATAFIEAQRLRGLLITFNETADTEILDRIIDRLRFEAKAAKRAADPEVDAQILLTIGYDLIAAVDKMMTQMSKRQAGAITWRDGFMIALLALRPLRIHNFASLRLQYNLIISCDTAWFRFGKAAMKNGHVLEVPYPAELLPQLYRYIRHIRPVLLEDRSSSHLWLSRLGLPMRDAVVRRIIKDRTAEALGYPVSPHGFRHAAVTYLAKVHPESIATASDLLGHSDPKTTEAYYNLIPPRRGAAEIQEHLIREAQKVRVRTARARNKPTTKR